MSHLQLLAISKSFPQPASRLPHLPVLKDFSLDVPDADFVTLFGPNGCGKTTILAIASGLLQPDSGTATLDGHNPAEQRKLAVGFVFQNYAETLLPWRTARDNISLPLELQHVPRAKRDQALDVCLRDFGLLEHQLKYPYQLSGGLKQMLAIARATIGRPDLLLLDEPFASLDYSVARSAWVRIRHYCRSQRLTTVFVSHSIDEAIFLGNRVCVLSPRPAQIVATIQMPFDDSRSLDLLLTEPFSRIRATVLAAFEQAARQ